MINSIDIDRAKQELLPQGYKNLIDKQWYGAFRYASYIENYCNYDTYTKFVENATVDELDEMERLYLNDWQTRKYSKTFKMFLTDERMEKITEEQWKKILRSDIQNFYDTIMKDSELTK